MLAQVVTEKTLLLAVVLIGMFFCAGGIAKVAALGTWLHPMSLAAYALGVLVLIVAGAVVFDITLPLIDSERTALIVVVVVAAIKVVLTQVHHRVPD